MAILAMATASPSSTHAQGWSGGSFYQELSPESLNTLVGPVALYPDPLLAQVLQASAYPNEISQAQQWVAENPDLSGIDQQFWDPSVMAVARYPSVVNLLTQQPTWTQQLGLAYQNQPKGVMAAVQHQRQLAQQLGNLKTTPQQSVIVSGSTIQIVPASPQVIYVPIYSPSVIYTQPATYQTSPMLAFGAGFAMGSWMSSSVNWNTSSVVYYGGSGGWGDIITGPVGRAMQRLQLGTTPAKLPQVVVGTLLAQPDGRCTAEPMQPAALPDPQSMVVIGMQTRSGE